MANTLLQDGDLAYLRAEALTSLPDKVDIQRKTNTADGQGGFAESWSIAYSNISARIAYGSGTNSVGVEQENRSRLLTVSVAYNQSIEQGDRVLSGGDTLEVISINLPDSWHIFKTCQVRQI
tara:strand:+ start:13395 stop:13760 length:366 start_codon:yes stop_codon:yes gene_type:complete